jgi:P-type conjugative transfer protein TrbJ
MRLHNARILRLLVASALIVSVAAMPARAQFGFGTTVYDPTAVGQLVSQVSNQVKMLNQMVQQVQQGQSMLSALPGNDVVPALASLSQQSQLLMGNLSNIGSLGGSLTSDLNSQYPTDFSSLQGVSSILSKLAAMQTQTRSAMQQSMALQNQVASNQARIAGAANQAVIASNGAPGATAALQATNQLLGTLSQQMADLQSVLIAHMRAEDAERMNNQSIQAGQTAASAAFIGSDSTPSGLQITNY